MKVLDASGNGAPGVPPSHETTGLFFPQFVAIPGQFGQMQLMLVPGSGIPMRDYFAAKAMQALMTSDDSNTDPEMYGVNAKWAYRMADAMIEARKTEKLFNNSQFHEDHMSK